MNVKDVFIVRILLGKENYIEMYSYVTINIDLDTFQYIDIGNFN